MVEGRDTKYLFKIKGEGCHQDGSSHQNMNSDNDNGGSFGATVGKRVVDRGLNSITINIITGNGGQEVKTSTGR